MRRAPLGAVIAALVLAPWLLADAQEARGEKWAVVVGANRDAGKHVAARKLAVADAEGWYALLTTTGGFKKDHVMLLTDRSERKPTLRNIKFAIGTFLGRSAEPDDVVILYLAGQGGVEADARGTERDGLVRYFMPSDAVADDLFSTAVPLSEFLLLFGRIRAERAFLFLDADYSGAVASLPFPSKRTPGGSEEGPWLERLARSRGRVILAASQANQLAREDPRLGHGIFTHYVLEGLGGAADVNGDGVVSVDELYAYVERHVPPAARALGGDQHPTMKGELTGALPFIRIPRN